MSNTSQGEGWWQASDGKWYPPEQHPDRRPAPPPQVSAGERHTITMDRRKGTAQVVGRTLVLTINRVLGPERTEIDLVKVSTVNTKRQHIEISGSGIDVEFSMGGFSASKNADRLAAEINAARSL